MVHSSHESDDIFYLMRKVRPIVLIAGKGVISGVFTFGIFHKIIHHPLCISLLVGLIMEM